MRTHMPVARTDHLVMTEAGDELVVFDQQSHHLHHLNQASACIWRLCDGTRSPATLAVEASAALGEDVPESIVMLALADFAGSNLLIDASVPTAAGQSRRSLMRKAATAAAVPVIVSVTAPLAASASSHLNLCYLQNWACEASLSSTDLLELCCVPVENNWHGGVIIGNDRDGFRCWADLSPPTECALGCG